MAMTEWYSYQAKRQDKDKPQRKPSEKSEVKPLVEVDPHSRMLVVESTPSDTYIQRMREGILNRLK